MQKLEALVEKYVEAIITHGEESEKGNYIIANKNYKKKNEYYNEIILYNEEGYEELKKLLLHKNDHVKIGVAYHLLSYDSDIASEVLNSLIDKPKGIGFKAKMILSEWKEGNL